MLYYRIFKTDDKEFEDWKLYPAETFGRIHKNLWRRKNIEICIYRDSEFDFVGSFQYADAKKILQK